MEKLSSHLRSFLEVTGADSAATYGLPDKSGIAVGMVGCSRTRDGQYTAETPYMLGTVVAELFANPCPRVYPKVEIPRYGQLVGVFPDMRSAIAVPAFRGDKLEGGVFVYTRLLGKELTRPDLLAAVMLTKELGFNLSS